jgi:hypothetical protein
MDGFRDRAAAMTSSTDLQVFDWSDPFLRRLTLEALAEAHGASESAVITQHLAIVRAGVAAAENQGTNVSFHVVGDATVFRLCDAPHPLDRMFYRIQALH